MEFYKYPSITNSYSSKFLGYVGEAGFASEDVVYAVQEKIHGANFAIYVDANGAELATRSHKLAENESFYNIGAIEESLKQTALEFYQIAKRAICEPFDFDDYDGFIIHGELCGGSYPNIKSQQKAVQKGVYYSPNLEFFAFDVTGVNKISVPDIDNKPILVDKHTLLDVDVAEYFAVRAGFHWTPILFEGSLEECLQLPNEFKSQIAYNLGLPEIDEPNICEGVVIKPFKPLFLHNGSRVIFKNKNEKFSEKTRTPKVKIELSENLQRVIAEARLYVTEPRYDNVTSKMDAINYDDKSLIGVLIQNLTRDIFEEINRENPELFIELEKEDQKQVNRAVSHDVKKLILAKF